MAENSSENRSYAEHSTEEFAREWLKQRAAEVVASLEESYPNFAADVVGHIIGKSRPRSANAVEPTLKNGCHLSGEEATGVWGSPRGESMHGSTRNEDRALAWLSDSGMSLEGWQDIAQEAITRAGGSHRGVPRPVPDTTRWANTKARDAWAIASAAAIVLGAILIARVVGPRLRPVGRLDPQVSSPDLKSRDSGAVAEQDQGQSGERALARAEILALFGEVTSRPRDTWIPAGTIEATRTTYRAPQTTDEAQISQAIQSNVSSYLADPDKLERTSDIQKMRLDAIPFNTRYRLANESTMTTGVTVKYDGKRFYWAINVVSRQDSVEPDASLAANYLTDDFNIDWNGRYVRVWDGHRHTSYAPASEGTRVDSISLGPTTLPDALTVGLNPLREVVFVHGATLARNASASEVHVDGGSEIRMDFGLLDGPRIRLALDPAKDCALTTCTVIDWENSVSLTYRYSGYRQVGDHWVPTTVVIERRDGSTHRLLRSDSWAFGYVDTATPAVDTFHVDFESDMPAQFTAWADAALPTFLRSHTVDTDRLLADRLAYAAAEGVVPQNCATAAIQYAASELGGTVSTDALKSLVGARGETTLLAMKRFLLGQGLYCRAVRTDVEALRVLEPARAILYLPDKDHFVVLDRVNGRYAWLIDLTADRFYYRVSLWSLSTDWTSGAALVLSKQPITGPYEDIPDAVAEALRGGRSETPGWTLRTRPLTRGPPWSRVPRTTQEESACFALILSAPIIWLVRG